MSQTVESKASHQGVTFSDPSCGWWVTCACTEQSIMHSSHLGTHQHSCRTFAAQHPSKSVWSGTSGSSAGTAHPGDMEKGCVSRQHRSSLVTLPAPQCLPWYPQPPAIPLCHLRSVGIGFTHYIRHRNKTSCRKSWLLHLHPISCNPIRQNQPLYTYI